MNLSSKEIGRPEQEPINEQKADEKQVSPSIANAVLADSSFYIAVSKSKKSNGKDLVSGKIIKRSDGKLFGIYKTSEINGRKVVWSLTCLHTGYSLQRFSSIKEAVGCKHLGFCCDVQTHNKLMRLKPINDLSNFR